MRKLVPLGLIAVLVLAGSIVSSPIGARAQGAGLVSSILNKMERNRRNLHSLRASISMEKYNAQLHDSDRYKGTVAYVPATGRNAYVRVEWQRPQHEILAVANGNYTLYRPRLNMAYVGNARSSRATKVSGALDFLTMSSAQVQNRFEPLQDLYDETLWGGVHTVHFKLVPKGGASYSYAEVWVDDGGMPIQTKVVERNGDATTVRLTDVERNPSIPLDQFTIKLDPSVKQVRG